MNGGRATQWRLFPQPLTDSFSLSPPAPWPVQRRMSVKNFRSIFARFRLLSSVMALAVLLGALAVTPTHADQCDDICSGWTRLSGCTTCNHCCVRDDGSYYCQPKNDRDC